MLNDYADIFLDSSWLQVMLGQGIRPRDYHPAADLPSDEQLRSVLARIASAKRQPLAQLPSHDDFLHQYAGVAREGNNRG